MSEEQIEQLVEEQQKEVDQQPEVKTRKAKVYIKKGIDNRGRKPIPDKQTVYGLPADPDYHKKYYHQKLAIKVQCDQCLLFVAKVNLKKHQTSAYHQKFCQIIQDNKIENV